MFGEGSRSNYNGDRQGGRARNGFDQSMGRSPRVGTGSNRIPVTTTDNRLTLRLGQGGRGGGTRGRGRQIQHQIQKPKPNLTLKLSKKIVEPAKKFLSMKKGLCSLFLIDVKKGSKAYRYDVEICEKRRGKPLSKASDDGQRSLFRNLCYEILTTVFLKTNSLGMNEGGEIVYDCKSALYTSTPIHLDSSSMDLMPEEVGEYVQTYFGNTGFSVTITPNQACHVLDLANLSQYETKTSVYDEDRSVRTFLEMAITQFSLNENAYTPIGAGKLFEVPPDTDGQQPDNQNQYYESYGKGIVFRSGVAKGVRVVKNDGRTPSLAVVLDAKICAFYQKQSLVDTVLSLIEAYRPPSGSGPPDWKRINRAIDGLRVEVSYNLSRNFQVGKLSDRPVARSTTMYEGRKMSLTDFFKIRHGITLVHPDFPAVSPAQTPKGRNPEIFPLEVLMIMDGQRVPVEKMDKKLADKLLKINSILPNERYDKIMNHANQLGIFNPKNAVLCAFGITIKAETCQTVVGVRKLPQICFGDEKIVEPEPDKANWAKASTNLKYIEASTITQWIVLCDKKDYSDVKKFIKVLKNQALKKDMVLAEPTFITFNADQGENWTEKFKDCIKYGSDKIDYIILIDSKPKFENSKFESSSHDILKFYEARYKVVTQHITLERVKDVLGGKTATLENIVHKMNAKYFGLNYEPIVEEVAAKFALERSQTLVIAYDVAHPPPVTNQERRYVRQVAMKSGVNIDCFDPSVVGICANMTSNPHAFVGDYFYQQSRKESVDTKQLQNRVTWILENLRTSRPEHSTPKYVFILRDGLSEGQALMAFNEELEAIKAGLNEYNRGIEWKLIFVIGTKRHFKKFFVVGENEEVMNLDPGSVINEKFVRADLPEFFMQSHYPIKGVGKPVEYSVIFDEIGVTQDELQGFLNALCYSHQIVNSAISIPEPIYQADELAKRGRNNYLTLKKQGMDNVPKAENGLVDHDELGQMLSYRFDTKNPKSLALARVTA